MRNVFAQAFREVVRPTPLYRLTQFDDPVPLTPARGIFERVGTEVCFWDRTEPQLCDGAADRFCSTKHGGTFLYMVLQRALSRTTCGHRAYLLKERPFLGGC